MMSEVKTRYFVAKATNFTALKQCLKTEQWACRDRTSPPHPRELLQEALGAARVILLYSVNNCHGWHGYAEMIGPPSTSPPIKSHQTKDAGVLSDTTDSFIGQVAEAGDCQSVCSVSDDGWFYFPVSWKLAFLRDFGEQCLSSKLTDNFSLLDGSPLNKSRNWQEVPESTGEKLCGLMDDCYRTLLQQREEKLRKVEERQLPPFFATTDVDACEKNWRKIVEKVESELGPVLLACPFGSQRYNLQTPESDTDMFLVYQAPTRQVLGFKPPKQTIKSSDRELCDYTIHEVYRYCELLMSGDARCVETLFLDPSTVIQMSPAMEDLIQGRKLLLNRECLSKYTRDAQGTKGTKQLRKWCDENQTVEILPPRLCKLVYVIVRLLQNAVNIVRGEDLRVYREEGSQEREILMSIRQGNLPVKEAWEIINRLEDELERGKSCVAEKTKNVDDFLEGWMLSLRLQDLKTCEETSGAEQEVTSTGEDKTAENG